MPQTSINIGAGEGTCPPRPDEIALVTGMRPEEYLGLRWSDIDLAKGIISVQKASLTLIKYSFEIRPENNNLGSFRPESRKVS